MRREEYLTATGSGREEHIDLGRWPDVFCVAPATAHLLASLALGLADSFLTTTALVHEGPLVVVPAMASDMWTKSIVQQHVRTLDERGVVRVGPVHGPLATGEMGEGRMAEPEDIQRAIEALFRRRDLEGRTVIVTAGPTREPIDPVRFLSNRSSGKMGFALARAAAERGARVQLIAGPVALETPAGVERFDVETALEMEAKARESIVGADLFIMTAAVSDFRPTSRADEKIKKRDGSPEILLTPNPDILDGLRDVETAAVRVGFAAETAALEAEAKRKLEAKKLDFIVANDVSRSDIGFASDENEVLVLSADREPVSMPLQSKTDLAHELLDLFVGAMTRRETDVVTSHS